jgi:hypothetical protein
MIDFLLGQQTRVSESNTKKKRSLVFRRDKRQTEKRESYDL